MKKVKFILLLIIGFSVILTGCGTEYLDIPRGVWVRVDVPSEHFIYYTYEDNELTEETLNQIGAAIERLEGFYSEIGSLWGYQEQIKYYKFESKEQIEQLTGRSVTGKAILDQNIVHSMYYSDAHEVAHLFTCYDLVQDKGSVDVANFWLEGIAMYYTWPRVYFGETGPDGEPVIQTSIGVIEGETVHEQAAKFFKNETETPDLTKMIYSNDYFNSLGTLKGYSIAGSFVTHLIGQYDSNTHATQIEKFKVLLNKLNYCSSQQEVLDAFYEVYNKSFAEVVEEWKDFLYPLEN